MKQGFTISVGVHWLVQILVDAFVVDVEAREAFLDRRRTYGQPAKNLQDLRQIQVVQLVCVDLNRRKVVELEEDARLLEKAYVVGAHDTAGRDMLRHFGKV